MQTAIEAVNHVTDKAPALQDKKNLEKCEIGKGIRQGDLYVIRINPTGKTKIKGLAEPIDADLCTMLGSDQLVDGSTTGSRHTIREGQASFYRDPTGSNPVFGGIVRAKGQWDLEHPEHAHWSMPEGCYGIFYQLDWATKQRVRD